MRISCRQNSSCQLKYAKCTVLGKFMAAKYQPKLVRILPTTKNGVLTLESVDKILDPIHVKISDVVVENKQRKTE